jgi:hypothetical protein
MIPSEGFRVCPACGRANGAGYATCQGCGISLFGVPLRAPTDDATDSGRGSRPSHVEAVPPPKPIRPLSEDELYPPAARGGTTGIAREGGPQRITRYRRPVAALVIGPALIAVGVVLIASIYVLNAAPHTEYLKANGTQEDIWTFSPSTLTGLTAVVHWFDGVTGTHVYMVFGKPDCVIPSGVVAQGAGISGTFRAPLDPGTVYSLFACQAGAPSSINATVSLQGGLTLGEVVAGFTVGIGFGLIAVGLRGRPVVVHPHSPTS